VFTGRQAGRPLRVVFAPGTGRLERVSWPIFSARGEVDQLDVEYEWEPWDDAHAVLRGVVMRLETRRWRCKIRAS
ncbi:MAG: hypothetical protein P8181_15670, partial [bacterium]